MDCQKIETALNKLKVNKAYSIRGKSRVIDELHSIHLKAMDDVLMDIRVFVARLSTGNTSTQVLKEIDEFIYKKQMQ